MKSESIALIRSLTKLKGRNEMVCDLQQRWRRGKQALREDWVGSPASSTSQPRRCDLWCQLIESIAKKRNDNSKGMWTTALPLGTTSSVTSQSVDQLVRSDGVADAKQRQSPPPPLFQSNEDCIHHQPGNGDTISSRFTVTVSPPLVSWNSSIGIGP